MKTRKLFAILTLVAFMMTLLPVAAFAGQPENPYNTASKSASKISIESKSKSVGNKVEVTVALRDANNRPANTLTEAVYGADWTLAGAEYALFIWPERASDSLSDVDSVVAGSLEGATGTLQGNVIKVTSSTLESNFNGTIKVEYTSNVAGEVTYKAALISTEDINVDNVDVIEFRSHVLGKDEYLIGSTAFEWKQLGVNRIVLRGVSPAVDVQFEDDMKWVDENGDVITPTPADPLKEAGVFAKGNVYKLKGFKADGDDYEFTFEVLDKNGVPLAGEKVEFSLNKSGAHLNKTEATTDVLGQVKVKVYAYEADDYKLTVKRGSTIAVVEMDFGASAQAFDIVGPEPITDKVAVGYSPSLEFKVFDVFGNRMLGETLKDIIDPDEEDEVDGKITDGNVVFSKKPSGSDLEDSDLGIKLNDTDEKATALEVDFEKDPDVAGTYEIKVKLPNGKFATASFEAAEQGEITRMALDIKESYLAYGSTSSAAKVKYYDNNNVYYEDEDLTTVELSVSNNALAKIEDDKYVKAREYSYNDYSSGKVVITAIDTARGLVATDEIVIGSVVAGLEVAAPEEDALLNESATITYQLVNQNGDPIAFRAGSDKEKIDVDAYVISKPEGADVDINLPLKSDYQNSLSRTGKINVTVESDTEGTVVLAFVVKGVVDESGDLITLSNTTEIKFVAERVKIGAENVTLFIGSTNYVVDGQPKVSDLAPFIQDNRTFVPVRVVGEALGAEVEWDAATQTVTIAREDLTATLTIGSNEITLSDGTVVVSDVAPFIKEGRTVLPFRVIGEIFGAEVEAVSAADGRTIAVQFQQ